MLNNLVIPLVATSIFSFLLFCILEYLMRHLLRKTYAGPEELTSLFDEGPKPSVRKRRCHTVPFKMMVLEEVQKHGLTWTISRYNYLGLSKSDIRRWQTRYFK